MLQAGDLNLGQIGLQLPQGDQTLGNTTPETTFAQSVFPPGSDPQQHNLLVREDNSLLQQVGNPPVVTDTNESASVTLDPGLITPTQQQDIPIIPVSFSSSSAQPSTSSVLMTPTITTAQIGHALNLSTASSVTGALPEDLTQHVQQLTPPMPIEKQPQISMTTLDPSASPITTQPSVITSQTDPIINEMLQTVQDKRTLLGEATLTTNPSGDDQQTFQLTLGGETLNLSQNIVLQPGIGGMTGASHQTALNQALEATASALNQALEATASSSHNTVEVLKVNIYQDPEQETPGTEVTPDDRTAQSKQGTISVAEAAASIGSLYTCSAQDCSQVRYSATLHDPKQ